MKKLMSNKMQEDNLFTTITGAHNWKDYVVTKLWVLVDEETLQDKIIKIHKYRCPFETSHQCRSRCIKVLYNAMLLGFKAPSRKE